MRMIKLIKCEQGQYKEILVQFNPQHKSVAVPVPEPNWFEKILLWIAEPRNAGRLRGHQYEY